MFSAKKKEAGGGSKGGSQRATVAEAVDEWEAESLAELERRAGLFKSLFPDLDQPFLRNALLASHCQVDAGLVSKLVAKQADGERQRQAAVRRKQEEKEKAKHEDIKKKGEEAQLKAKQDLAEKFKIIPREEIVQIYEECGKDYEQTVQELLVLVALAEESMSQDKSANETDAKPELKNSAAKNSASSSTSPAATSGLATSSKQSIKDSGKGVKVEDPPRKDSRAKDKDKVKDKKHSKDKDKVHDKVHEKGHDKVQERGNEKDKGLKTSGVKDSGKHVKDSGKHKIDSSAGGGSDGDKKNVTDVRHSKDAAKRKDKKDKKDKGGKKDNKDHVKFGGGLERTESMEAADAAGKKEDKLVNTLLCSRFGLDIELERKKEEKKKRREERRRKKLALRVAKEHFEVLDEEEIGTILIKHDYKVQGDDGALNELLLMSEIKKVGALVAVFDNVFDEDEVREVLAMSEWDSKRATLELQQRLEQRKAAAGGSDAPATNGGKAEADTSKKPDRKDSKAEPKTPADTTKAPADVSKPEQPAATQPPAIETPAAAAGGLGGSKPPPKKAPPPRPDPALKKRPTTELVAAQRVEKRRNIGAMFEKSLQEREDREKREQEQRQQQQKQAIQGTKKALAKELEGIITPGMIGGRPGPSRPARPGPGGDISLSSPEEGAEGGEQPGRRPSRPIGISAPLGGPPGLGGVAEGDAPAKARTAQDAQFVDKFLEVRKARVVGAAGRRRPTSRRRPTAAAASDAAKNDEAGEDSD